MAGIHDLIKVHGVTRARELVAPDRRSILEIAIRYLAKDANGLAYIPASP